MSKASFYTKETIANIGTQNLNLPAFGIGDVIIVSQRIKEAGKERLQAFQGNVIAIHKRGISSTFTVRKMSDNSVAVERIFPYYSPLIEGVRVMSKGDVRRAKLFYLRHKVGKKSHVKQLVETKASAQVKAAKATTE
jgi:large subunit ribosomal protein L19